MDLDTLSNVEVFPLLVPQNSKLTTYQGFLTVQGYEYLFRIELPSTPYDSLKGASLQCSESLRDILRGSEDLIQQRLAHSKDLNSFLIELKDVLERILRVKKTTDLPPVNFYSHLMGELDQIGWKRVKSIDKSLTRLELIMKDSGNRQHVLSVKLPSDYPVSPPDCTADLPTAVELRWIAGTTTLLDALHQYEKALELYQDLWKLLEDIDTNTWVLEPEHPTYAITMRRIALGNHCSLQVTVDANRPRATPVCSFMGADSITGPLREQFNKNLHKWNSKMTLRENLESLLGIKFPSPKTSQKEEFSVECGICYSYRLDNALPDRVCDNQKCGKPFHRTCLFEWLRAIPSSRQSFDTIFGECPYCSSPITCKTS